MSLNIISDVAGQYDALLRLTSKMPKAPFLGVGDLVDRGPKSGAVVEWFMNNGDSLMGNHEDMMIDFVEGTKKYDHGLWVMNGGGYTLRSYGFDDDGEVKIPKDHIKWLKSRDYIYETDDLLVSHAPIKDLVFLKEFDFLWNRKPPIKRDKFQVFGHNSMWGIKWFKDESGNKYAVCLDDSQNRMLTGMHWPSMEIFQEPYEPL